MIRSSRYRNPARRYQPVLRAKSPKQVRAHDSFVRLQKASGERPERQRVHEFMQLFRELESFFYRVFPGTIAILACLSQGKEQGWKAVVEHYDFLYEVACERNRLAHEVEGDEPAWTLDESSLEHMRRAVREVVSPVTVGGVPHNYITPYAPGRKLSDVLPKFDRLFGVAVRDADNQPGYFSMRSLLQWLKIKAPQGPLDFGEYSISHLVDQVGLPSCIVLNESDSLNDAMAHFKDIGRRNISWIVFLNRTGKEASRRKGRLTYWNLLPFYQAQRIPTEIPNEAELCRLSADERVQSFLDSYDRMTSFLIDLLKLEIPDLSEGRTTRIEHVFIESEKRVRALRDYKAMMIAQVQIYVRLMKARQAEPKVMFASVPSVRELARVHEFERAVLATRKSCDVTELFGNLPEVFEYSTTIDRVIDLFDDQVVVPFRDRQGKLQLLTMRRLVQYLCKAAVLGPANFNKISIEEVFAAEIGEKPKRKQNTSEWVYIHPDDPIDVAWHEFESIRTKRGQKNRLWACIFSPDQREFAGLASFWDLASIRHRH